MESFPVILLVQGNKCPYMNGCEWVNYKFIKHNPTPVNILFTEIQLLAYNSVILLFSSDPNCDKHLGPRLYHKQIAQSRSGSLLCSNQSNVFIYFYKCITDAGVDSPENTELKSLPFNRPWQLLWNQGARLACKSVLTVSLSTIMQLKKDKEQAQIVAAHLKAGCFYFTAC